MNWIKRQKDIIPKIEPLRSEGVQYATGEEWRRITNSPRMNEEVGPNLIRHSVVDVSGGESKADAVKNNIAQESRMLGP